MPRRFFTTERHCSSTYVINRIKNQHGNCVTGNKKSVGCGWVEKSAPCENTYYCTRVTTKYCIHEETISTRVGHIPFILGRCSVCGVLLSSCYRSLAIDRRELRLWLREHVAVCVFPTVLLIVDRVLHHHSAERAFSRVRNPAWAGISVSYPYTRCLTS